MLWDWPAQYDISKPSSCSVIHEETSANQAAEELWDGLFPIGIKLRILCYSLQHSWKQFWPYPSVLCQESIRLRLFLSVLKLVVLWLALFAFGMSGVAVYVSKALYICWNLFMQILTTASIRTQHAALRSRVARAGRKSAYDLQCLRCHIQWYHIIVRSRFACRLCYCNMWKHGS